MSAIAPTYPYFNLSQISCYYLIEFVTIAFSIHESHFRKYIFVDIAELLICSRKFKNIDMQYIYYIFILVIIKI